MMLRFVAVAALMLLGIAPLMAQTQSSRSAAELMDAVMWNRETIGGPFALVDHTGKPRTDADFRGKLMLVYFGFTWCPDICPTDLQNIGLALDELGDAADKVQPLFITVDPARDTPEHLRDYVPMFHPRLIGLTGSAAAIHSAAAAYRVYFAQVPLKGDDYTVDHSSFIYLMGADGKYSASSRLARRRSGSLKRCGATLRPRQAPPSPSRRHCPGTRCRQAPGQRRAGDPSTGPSARRAGRWSPRDRAPHGALTASPPASPRSRARPSARRPRAARSCRCRGRSRWCR